MVGIHSSSQLLIDSERCHLRIAALQPLAHIGSPNSTGAGCLDTICVRVASRRGGISLDIPFHRTSNPLSSEAGATPGRPTNSFLVRNLQLAYSLAMLTSDAGVQGSIAGFPCDVLIVDDPYKDHLEAHSG